MIAAAELADRLEAMRDALLQVVAGKPAAEVMSALSAATASVIRATGEPPDRVQAVFAASLRFLERDDVLIVPVELTDRTPH